MTATANRDGSRSAAILLIISLLLGFGVALAAATTIVSANGPGDSAAIMEGPGAPLPANQLLGYGS